MESLVFTLFGINGEELGRVELSSSSSISDLRAEVREATGVLDFDLALTGCVLGEEGTIGEALGEAAASEMAMTIVQSPVPKSGLELWLDASSDPWTEDRSHKGRQHYFSGPGNPPVVTESLGVRLPIVRFQGRRRCVFERMPVQTIFIVCRLAVDASCRAGVVGGFDQDIGIRYYDIPVGSGWSKWMSSDGHHGAELGGDQNDFVSIAGGPGSNHPKHSAGRFFVNGEETFDVAKDQWHVISAVRDTTFQNMVFCLGGYFPGREFKGDIAEVLAYSRRLDDDERVRVERYLSSKWII